MNHSKRKVELRYYDGHLKRSRNPDEAFQQVGDSITTRFVLTYGFTIREQVVNVTLSTVVFHFFHPGALLNHLEYMLNVIKKRKGSDGFIRMQCIQGAERDRLLEILHMTVIGAGIAGAEKGVLKILWCSGSLNDLLHFSNPKIPSPSHIQDRLEKRLGSVLSHQT